MIITCQHEWVKQCQLRYRVEPPIGYRFENAHYPEPECRNGTETVRLWYPDHIVHGAIQTLNLQHPCMHGYRVHTEKDILQEVYPEYSELYKEAYKFCQSFAVKRLNKIIHAERDEFGRSIFALKSLSNAYQGQEKDERGVPVGLIENGKRLHIDKDEFGRSKRAMTNLEKMNREKDEFGRSVNGVKGAEKLHAQVWESMIDGFRSGAGPVARHNKANGWDPAARIRVS